MLKDELFIELCKALVSDSEIISGAPWSVLVMVGEVEPGSASLYGYRFDAQGEWKAVSPSGETALDILPRLCDAMAANDPARTPWVACLVRIDAQEPVHADFEYDDPTRWHLTAANHSRLVQDFSRIATRGMTPGVDA